MGTPIYLPLQCKTIQQTLDQGQLAHSNSITCIRAENAAWAVCKKENATIKKMRKKWFLSDDKRNNEN